MNVIYIIVEAPSNAALLKHLLPNSQVYGVRLVTVNGKYAALSMAVSIRANRHASLVLVLDADSENEEAKRESERFYKELLNRGDSETEAMLVFPRPNLASILFKDRRLAERLFERRFDDATWFAAHNNPKAFLSELGGDVLARTIPNASPEIRNKLQDDPVINEVIFAMRHLAGTATANSIGSSDLESRFHREMLSLYSKAGEQTGYWPSGLLSSVRKHGGVNAAKRWLGLKAPTSGLRRLAELGRLDLSVEALVLKQPWSHLFTTEEKRMATVRLAEFGYRGTWDKEFWEAV